MNRRRRTLRERNEHLEDSARTAVGRSATSRATRRNGMAGSPLVGPSISGVIAAIDTATAPERMPRR